MLLVICFLHTRVASYIEMKDPFITVSSVTLLVQVKNYHWYDLTQNLDGVICWTSAVILLVCAISPVLYLALDKTIFLKKCIYFSNFPTKAYVVGTH